MARLSQGSPGSSNGIGNPCADFSLLNPWKRRPFLRVWKNVPRCGTDPFRLGQVSHLPVASLDEQPSAFYAAPTYEFDREAHVPGGDPAAAEHRHPFALHRQRDLRPRAGLQRRRRLREAPLHPVVRHRSPPGRHPANHHPGHRRQGGHPYHHRHRRGHDPRRAGEEPRHHRALRDQGVPQADGGGQKGGRGTDRPVRRGILLGLHGGEARDRGEPFRRR